MNQDEKLRRALRLLEEARMLLASLAPAGSTAQTEELSSYEEGDNEIVEGIFDGQNMVGPNGRIYPIAPNYVSKSKLVEGDKLKLTILPNGKFLFKQIEPMDRASLKGILIKEDGLFKVEAEGRSYRVILAAVTYYKGQVGDEVILIVPADKNSTWGAIEAIIPH